MAGLTASLLSLTAHAETAKPTAAPQPTKQETTAQKQAKDRQTLSRAYKREFAFLESEKRALLKRLSNLQNQHETNRNQLEEKISVLKAKLLGFSAKTTSQNNRLFKLEDRLSNSEAAADNLESIVEQAQSEGLLSENPEQPLALIEKLSATFTNGIQKAAKNATTRRAESPFFLTTGEKVTGKLLHIGQTMTYGVAEKESGLVTPLDGENYRIMTVSPEAQRVFQNAAAPLTLTAYVYEPSEKGVAVKKEKTFEDFLAAGGIIGWVIIGLGLLALLIALLRTVNLRKLGSGRATSDEALWAAIESGDYTKAGTLVSELSGSKNRLLTKGLELLQEQRAEIMDKLEELYLSEEGKIDRMGAMILVFAAVAPLMGLLGTVTGMISTFDIITEFGTGDPKLLSSGISEALVTTELGLIVAIPSLLLGNMLNGWADNIKGELESLILRLQNVASEKNPDPNSHVKQTPDQVQALLKAG